MPTSGPSLDGATHLVLVGMMGSGKTTVGRLVAARLGRPFVDSDEQVENRTGSTVREIFERDGEPAFRRLETDALRGALESGTPSVIAAAGGVVLDPENRVLLKSENVSVVWLRARPEVLAERAARGHHRPLLGNDPLAALRRMDEERTGLYEEVADKIVDVGELVIEDAVDCITKLVSTGEPT